MEISVSTNQKKNGLDPAGAGWRGAEWSAGPTRGQFADLMAAQPGGRGRRPAPYLFVGIQAPNSERSRGRKGAGGIGALLRREGLYSSHLTIWRHERDAGMRQGLMPKSLGPKRKRDSHQEELQQLRREVLRLNQALQRAETIIDVQKKLGSLLGWAALPDPDGKT